MSLVGEGLFGETCPKHLVLINVGGGRAFFLHLGRGSDPIIINIDDKISREISIVNNEFCRVLKDITERVKRKQVQNIEIMSVWKQSKR